jgi:hypothetical protein
MAVEAVRERLKRSTAVLDRHGVPYAVVGGHAVAMWVARSDPAAVRNTVDVDIMLRRADLPRAVAALMEAGFEAAHIHGVTLFLDKSDPNPRRAVHIVFAGEYVRPGEPHATPELGHIERSAEGFAVIDLLSLLVMKLTANRDKDRTHIRDMLELNMIPADLAAQLPYDLQARLAAIRASPE